MSNKREDRGQSVSRRGLFGKAALVVGAATSAAATRTVLARPSDIVMDSTGRVLVDGAALPGQKPEGSFLEAATRKALGDGSNNACTNAGGCGGGTNTGCQNTKGCVEAHPASAKPLSPNLKAVEPSGEPPKK
jgi:hypothetical protein